MKKTSSELRWIFAAILFAAPAVAHAEPSAGDIAQARELFNQAIQTRDQGDARGALEKFKAAHALAGTPLTGLELGRTYVAAGMLVEARETFLAIARIPVSRAETTRSSEARSEAAKLARDVRDRIPTLTVRITGVQAETVSVTLDGATIPTAALAAPRLVNAGTHTLVATSSTGGRAETTVELKEREVREIELNIAFTSARPQEPARRADRATPRALPPRDKREPMVPRGQTSPFVYVGFGVAGAAALTGAVTGVLALSKASSVNGACTSTTCPPSATDDLDSGRALGNVSTAAFVVAGVGGLVGLASLLWLSPRTEPVRPIAPQVGLVPWIGLGSAGLRGSF